MVGGYGKYSRGSTAIRWYAFSLSAQEVMATTPVVLWLSSIDAIMSSTS